ncbi:MAG: YcaO-like family protein [Candidatus Saccharimonadales bacterium]
MKTEFRPLCVVPAVPNDEGIRFLHLKQQYDISNFVEVVWSILAKCNGYVSEAYVAEQVCMQYPVNREAIHAIINDLQQLGILVDSREVFKHFHAFTANPSVFFRALTFDEIADYTESSRLPVQEGRAVKLEASDGPVAELLRKRKSCRSFMPDPLTLQQIGRVCTSAYSVRDHTTPSAGGLYPLKLYLILVRDQVDLAAGYYEYDPEQHLLVKYQDEPDVELLQFAFDSDTLLYAAPVIFVISSDLWRHPGKYSNRGYRYTLLEAGHAAQNIHLVATENGLATLEYGGYLDDVLAKELDMQEGREFPLITIAMGRPSNQPAFDSMHLFENFESTLIGRGKPVNSVRLTSGWQPEKGEAFFAASAHYAPSPNQDARRTYRDRFAYGTATSSYLAQVKAVVEAYERFASSRVRVDVTARAKELDEAWLDPRLVAPLTEKQYAAEPFLKPFNEEIEWQWVYGMQHTGEAILVPVDLVFYPLRTATFGRKLCYEANSSGVAAFTNREEAVRRGLLELIERDAIMRNWFVRRPPKQIDSGQLPYHWRKRTSYWETQGRKVYVFDLSAHGVLVVNVVIVSDTEYPCFIDGAASSERSFEEAISKAFHEAELSLITSLRSPRSRRIRPEKVFSPLDHSKLYAYPDYLDHVKWMWSGEETTTIFQPNTTIEVLFEQLKPIVVSLSCENIPIHVVRVISEELVPINFGYGNEHYTHKTVCGEVDTSCLRLPHYFA